MDDHEMPDLVFSTMTYTFTANSNPSSNREQAPAADRHVVTTNFPAPDSEQGSSVLPPPTARTTHTRLRDSSYIPRPPNAFILFRSAFIQTQKQADAAAGRPSITSTTNHAALSRIIGAHWRALPQEEKEKWEEKAQRAQEEHRRRYPDWRFRPGSFRGGAPQDGKSIGKKKRPPGRAKAKQALDEKEAVAKKSAIIKEDISSRGRSRRRGVSRSRAIHSRAKADTTPPSLSPSSSSGVNAPISPSTSSPTSIPVTESSSASTGQIPTEQDGRRRSTRLLHSVQRSQARADRLEHPRAGEKRKTVSSARKSKGKQRNIELDRHSSDSAQESGDDDETLRMTLHLSKQTTDRVGQSSSNPPATSEKPAAGVNILDYDLYDSEYDLDERYDDEDDSDYTESDEEDEEDDMTLSRGRNAKRTKRNATSLSRHKIRGNERSSGDETDKEGRIENADRHSDPNNTNNPAESSLQPAPPASYIPEPDSFAPEDRTLTSMFKKRWTEERRSLSLPPSSCPPEPHPTGYQRTPVMTAPLDDRNSYTTYSLHSGFADRYPQDGTRWEVPMSPGTEPPTSPTSSPDTGEPHHPSSFPSWYANVIPGFSRQISLPVEYGYQHQSGSLMRDVPEYRYSNISRRHSRTSSDIVLLAPRSDPELSTMTAGGTETGSTRAGRRDTVSFPLTPWYQRQWGDSITSRHSGWMVSGQNNTADMSSTMLNDQFWTPRPNEGTADPGAGEGMGYLPVAAEPDFVTFHDVDVASQFVQGSSSSNREFEQPNIPQQPGVWESIPHRIGVGSSALDPHVHSVNISTFSSLSGWAGEPSSAERDSSDTVPADHRRASPVLSGWYDVNRSAVQPLGLGGGGSR